MDFYKITERPVKNGIAVAPSFLVKSSKDFMVRGRSFYAIWDGERWSTDEFDVQRIIDEEIDDYVEKLSKKTDKIITPLYLRNFQSNSWKEYRTFVNHMPDCSR